MSASVRPIAAMRVLRPIGCVAILVAGLSAAPTKALAQCNLSNDVIWPETASSADETGYSVGISGSFAVAGARGEDTRGTNAGAAYVLEAIPGGWQEFQKLTASDGADDDKFGSSVAISGNVVVVGSFGDDPGGSAYVYRFNGSTFQFEQKLVASDAVSGDSFGFAVDVSGSVIVVGAYGVDDNGASSGAAYVFRFNGSSWREEQKLYSPSAVAYDFYGAAVAVDQNQIVVGAYLDDSLATNAGAAYPYRWTGSSWVSEGRIVGNDSVAEDRFGTVVALSGSVLVAATDDHSSLAPNAGAAWVYTKSGSSWLFDQKLEASDGSDFDRFGVSADTDGQSIVVGAYQHESDFRTDAGAAYRFVRSGGVWVEEAKIVAPDAYYWDYFGFAVGVDGDATIVGSTQEDTRGNNAGAVYIFEGGCETGGCTSNSQCDDGNACTTDTCSSGTCVNAPRTCSDGNACTIDSCNPSTGCVFTTRNCNDGDACTTDSCVSSTGCRNTPIVCDDGVSCTTDVCVSGVCQFDDSGCECSTNLDCADGNSCTTDRCVSGACVITNNSNLCNDGNACTTGDVCSLGVCEGQPIVCNDGIACTRDSCVSGACVFDDSTCECLTDQDCSDGLACTQDRCVSGACTFDDSQCQCNTGADCDDGLACTIDRCTNRVCTYSDSACECSVDADCSDGNVCTTDRCNSGICSHSDNLLTCNDGNACTSGDRCLNGSCGGSPVVCDDGIACTVDSCSGGACVFDGGNCECSGDAECDDGSACTEDSCVDGSCQYADLNCECVIDSDCDDGNVCTNDSCIDGACVSADNRVLCNDGDACTTGDRCFEGSCEGVLLDCDDRISCTIDSCVGGVCVHNTQACSCESDADCDDGDPCTDDFCTASRTCSNLAQESCCGDNVCDAVESYCSCPSDCEPPSAVCGNGVCEAGDGEDCLTCPSDCAGEQGGNPRDRFCCGFGGQNPVGCLAGLCSANGFLCMEQAGATCCGDGVCEGDETNCNCPDDCDPVLRESGAEACTDGADNDCDGFADCNDQDCADEPSCWACDNDGVCELGEDCKSCPNDCDGKKRGRRLSMFCCGDGILQAAELDGEVCDGNP